MIVTTTYGFGRKRDAISSAFETSRTTPEEVIVIQKDSGSRRYWMVIAIPELARFYLESGWEAIYRVKDGATVEYKNQWYHTKGVQRNDN